jgi:L-malate glycosyltransferase
MGFGTEDISVKQMVSAMNRIMNNEIAINPVTSIERASQFNIEKGYENWIEIIDKMQ